MEVLNLVFKFGKIKEFAQAGSHTDLAFLHVICKTRAFNVNL